MKTRSFGKEKRGNYNTGLEGSQAVPACPYDMGNVYNQNFLI
jgi:hypothetical protein